MIIIKTKETDKGGIDLLHFIFFIWFLMDFVFKTNVCEAIGANRNQIDSIQNILTLALLFFYCIYGIEYSYEELGIILSVGALLSISGIRSHSYVLVSALLFMVIIKKVDISEIIRIVHRLLLWLVPITMALALCGVIDGGNTRRLLGSKLLRTRYGLGFTHPNTMAWCIFELLCCNFYLHRKRLRFIDYFITIAMIPFLYMVPNSLSAVVGTAVLIILMLMYQLIESRWESARAFFSKCLIIVGLVANFYSVFFTINSVSKYSFSKILDKFASYRLFYTNKSYSMYGITVWGQQIILKFAWERGYSETYLDNSFATLLLRYGVLCYVLYTIASFFVFEYLKKKDFALLICFFTFYFMGVMNSSVLSVGTNVFVLCFSYAIYWKYNSQRKANSQ